jgi:hypothetical protein
MAVLARRGGWAADEAPAHVVRYDNDALTVRLGAVPIADVLRELALQSGAEVRGQVREPRDVTATFDSVPLPEALARLLGDQNFALVYGGGGHLKAIRLLGGDGVLVPAPAPPVGERAPFPGALPALIERHPPVPVTGAVADAVKADVASLAQILELSLHHADPAVRAEALRTGITTLEAERDLYVAVLDELDHTDSAFLANLLRASASGHAEEVATLVSQDAHAAQLRLMASSVLQRLRRGD